MVAGGFTRDLAALGDVTEHDRRYTRLVEYTRLVKALCTNSSPVTGAGEFYATKELRLTPPVPTELAPELMVSGSSAAGLAAARELGAIAVKYPQPLHEEQRLAGAGRSGMRIGIIARDERESAWRVAYERFPEDRSVQIAHHLAMQASDSAWHRQLSALAHEAAQRATPYWLGPFRNYKSFCPYLVGSYDDVATELAGFVQRGFEHFVLEIPANEDELHQAAAALRRAVALAA
jgi:alkanesulfonate monooxygenase